MHVRGARCTGRAAGVHGRRAGARGAQLACAGAWLCARPDAREADGRATCVRGYAAVRACARLDARTCGYGCTVHPRARSSPKMRKST
ncbi:hypothetical protein CDL15_Pgr018390 [Punica granatum]|uniref:Uncharacterized protein n=1 Tax=Punica granatum TaxID=22663 RepID=A0A218W3T1_PUNGR|nr:hypothetical protein CDL15_Pgr018390 [Punica granatum]PKI70942.1 hypothetical protein CRG98_008675 [Punica granatum]